MQPVSGPAGGGGFSLVRTGDYKALIGHSCQGPTAGFVSINLVFNDSDSDSVIFSILLGENQLCLCLCLL